MYDNLPVETIGIIDDTVISFLEKSSCKLRKIRRKKTLITMHVFGRYFLKSHKMSFLQAFQVIFLSVLCVCVCMCIYTLAS